MAKEHMGPQFSEEDGPYCADCSDDMEEALEWHDRHTIHPKKRLTCKNCGAE